MLNLLAEIWSSLPVLSSIPGDWPPYSLLVVSSWNRYKVQIVSCIAELLQMLGLKAQQLLIDCFTRLVHDRSHTLLTNALYSSALAFRPYHHWKSSMWWCGQVLLLILSSDSPPIRSLRVCASDWISDPPVLWIVEILETDYLLSQNETLSRWNILYATLPHSGPLPWFFAVRKTLRGGVLIG